jgi:hypothetical protein
MFGPRRLLSATHMLRNVDRLADTFELGRTETI